MEVLRFLIEISPYLGVLVISAMVFLALAALNLVLSFLSILIFPLQKKIKKLQVVLTIFSLIALGLCIFSICMVYRDSGEILETIKTVISGGSGKCPTA